jgi:hypothetical protein
MHSIVSTSIAHILTMLCALNVAAFSNPDDMLPVSAALGSCATPGSSTTLDAIFDGGLHNPGIPLPPAMSEFSLGNVTYKQDMFCGSVDVSLYRVHEANYLPLAVMPTLCPLFVQAKNTIMSSDGGDALQPIEEVDDMDMESVSDKRGGSGFAVPDDERQINLDQKLLSSEPSDGVSWLLESVDTYACVTYVVGSRRLMHDSYDHRKGQVYHIYMETARLVRRQSFEIDAFEPDAFQDPSPRAGSEIVFSVSNTVDLRMQQGNVVAFYDELADVVYRGVVESDERITGRKHARSIRFVNMKQRDKKIFCELWSRAEQAPQCYLLIDVDVEDESHFSEERVRALITKHKTADDLRFPAVMLGVLGETQPDQVYLGTKAALLACVLEGSTGLIVDDRFYVESHVRSRWHFGDRIYVVMRDTEPILDGDEEQQDDRDSYLAPNMQRFELTYYNGRDIDCFWDALHRHRNRHVHYYAYVGQFVQTRSDPFYACCDVSLAALVDSEVKLLYDPRVDAAGHGDAPPSTAPLISTEPEPNASDTEYGSASGPVAGDKHGRADDKGGRAGDKGGRAGDTGFNNRGGKASRLASPVDETPHPPPKSRASLANQLGVGTGVPYASTPNDPFGFGRWRDEASFSPVVASQLSRMGGDNYDADPIPEEHVLRMVDQREASASPPMRGRARVFGSAQSNHEDNTVPELGGGYIDMGELMATNRPSRGKIREYNAGERRGRARDEEPGWQGRARKEPRFPRHSTAFEDDWEVVDNFDLL